MNPASDEMAAMASTIMVLCAAIMAIQRLVSNKTAEGTRLVWNRAMVFFMCLTTGLALVVVLTGYPAEATARGLTPNRYWAILALAYGGLMAAFATGVRWRPVPRKNSPFVW
ncbi:hypothetical protein [Paraburkholderia youngii]|uniref:hypothetical protein n=1 Tax=Paraburkholderia youngii TaxID=2782701 RepID=UPI003D1BDDD4